MKYSSIAIILVMHAMQMHAMDMERNAFQVSYLYYPMQEGMPVGHAGFAYGDNIDYELNQETKSLERAIEKATQKNGYPFFRFTFDVNKDEFEKMGEIIKTYEYTFQDNCSVKALKPLIDTRVCDVPFATSMSPMLTAAYLATGKQLGRNKVSKINFYGSRSSIKNIASMAPGIVGESMIAIGVPIMVTVAPYLLYSIYNNH